MSNEHENYEASPIEFMHARAQDEFHKLRKEKTKDLNVEINGKEFNKIIVAAKKATYNKYKTLSLYKPVLKSDLDAAINERPCIICGTMHDNIPPTCSEKCSYKAFKEPRLINYSDFAYVIRTLISEQVKIDYLEPNDCYLTEKVIDTAFSIIRKKQLYDAINT